MGTTIVAALVSEGRLTVASVGDSRLYLFDGRTLRQVTRDDSWIEAILDENPDADREALHVHPLRHALTNVLSTTGHAEIHIVEVSLDGGEVIALTTDGVHGTLDSSHIAHLLATLAEPADAAAELVAAAIGSGSTDNCTAVVATCLRELEAVGAAARICGIIPSSSSPISAVSFRLVLISSQLSRLLLHCRDGRAIFVRFCWS